MTNQFLLVVIAIVAVTVLIAVIFMIAKKRSTPKIDLEGGVKYDRSETVPEEIRVEIKAQAPVEVVAEEKIVEVIIPSQEEKLEVLTDRRKSDRTIQKRFVPEHGKITKQSFSEFAGERILVAEDNIINQKVLLGLLGESGIDIVMANDGQEALDILENDSNFLMILMDAHMPRVDGFEATRIIRQNPKFDHILVVALSGDTASDDIQKMKNAGMAEQLEKPLRMESLYKVIYAYSGQGTHKDEAVMSKSLDKDKGIQTCGGDKDFYCEILSEFITDYGNSSEKLGEFLRTDNMQDASAYLLDIIGVAENIGAHSLGEIAANIKLAISDPHELSYFSLFDQYRDQMDRLMQDIRAYLLR